MCILRPGPRLQFIKPTLQYDRINFNLVRPVPNVYFSVSGTILTCNQYDLNL